VVVPRCKLSFVDRDVPRGVASAVAGGRIGMGFLRSRACYWYVRFLVWGGCFSVFLRSKVNLKLGRGTIMITINAMKEDELVVHEVFGIYSIIQTPRFASAFLVPTTS